MLFPLIEQPYRRIVGDDVSDKVANDAEVYDEDWHLVDRRDVQGDRREAILDRCRGDHRAAVAEQVDPAPALDLVDL